MKYILITIVAILFASCSSPMMPVIDTTDDRLVIGSPWVDTLDGDSWIFEDDGDAYFTDGIFGGPAIHHTWSTNNGLLSLNGKTGVSYSISNNILTWGSKTFN